ncbi:hypothetical protein NUU61_007396 [Penicillium alfredii]|uniref:Uncharacterized protein n=1 Tax=Penicillium alfredii TaxID=1506179 RepID=A0A9W9F2T6_9EURO|nr:uncharacterized protein NUU61_007396 [Penicillium alfredii]KAJ5092526.1 hypothetical protein NUU61_007396 [Penicillium alfredii]
MPNARRLVLTAAVTSITIAGTLYGAGLKTNKEISENSRKHQETTFDEKLAALRGMRSNLTARKGMIESQIRDLDARVQEKQEKGIGGANHEEQHKGR